VLTFTPFGVVAVLLYLIIAISIGIKKKTPATRQVLYFVFFVYLLAVAKITLFPIPLHHYGVNAPANNLIPFHTIRAVIAGKSLSYDLYNLGGNILLFVPFGFLLPLISGRQNRFLRVVLLGFCMTLVLESGKFIISSILGFTYRDFDVDDLILNTFGAIVGFGILRFALLFWHSQHWKSPRMWRIGSPILVLIILGGVWGYEYESHATPTKSQESYDSNVLPLETIPFSKGVVLITTTDPRASKESGYVAWYLEKTKLWGWRLEVKSYDLLNSRNGSMEASFASMTVNGKTFAWGAIKKPDVQEIVYRQNGKTYKSHIGQKEFWDTSLPFNQTAFDHSDWTVKLKNGSIVPLFE